MIDWKKFILSFFQAVPWIKNLRYILGIGLIVLLLALCTNLWEKFFPSKPTVVNVAGDYVKEEPVVAHFGCSIWRANLKVWYAK
jgi:hypothetical protein